MARALEMDAAVGTGVVRNGRAGKVGKRAMGERLEGIVEKKVGLQLRKAAEVAFVEASWQAAEEQGEEICRKGKGGGKGGGELEGLADGRNDEEDESGKEGGE
eukprot:gene18467-22036_t